MDINEKNLNRWFELHAKMRSLKGFSKLSEEERNFLLTANFEFNPESVKQYLAVIGESDPEKAAKWIEQLGPGGVDALQEEFRKYTANDKSALIETAKKLAKEENTKNIMQGVDMLLAGADFAQAQNQINRFREESKRSRRPERPPILQRDPYLEKVKAEADRGLYDESTAIEAAKAGIQDSYLGDLANARIASGGQASSFGAYAQAAAGRRGRRSLELAPIANSIRQQQRERRDRLAALSSAENQAIQQSAAQYYPTDLAQYRFEQQQLANLGQAGYRNRRTALGEIANTIPGAIDRYTEQRYNRYYSSLGPKWADELMGATSELEGNKLHMDEARYQENMRRNELGSDYFGTRLV